MPAFPSGGAAVAVPPLYPDYVSNAVFVVGGNSASFSPFSGPKGSPFDAKTYDPTVYTPNPSTGKIANTADHSTGALCTGIGFESTDSGQLVAGIGNPLYSAAIPASVNNFSDSYVPGQTLPSGSAAPDARLLAIGGGKSVITPGPGTDYSIGVSTPVPYVSQPILDMGVGGSRDAGAGPAFTGFGMKLVTAAADVAQGAVIETGFVNRTAPAASGIVLKSGNNAFGSATAASPAVT